MTAYCSTTLQGDKCTDGRCPYRHDIVRCEPCRRSLPAAVFKRHQKAKDHLRNVAPNHPTNPGIPRPQEPPEPPLQPSPSNRPQFTPRADTSLISRDDKDTFTTNADPRVSVSGEGVVDFLTEGMGTVADPTFPPINQTILVENTSSSSNLSLQSMKLVPSPSPCFVARLLGKKVLVQQNSPRKVLVTFKAPHAGTFHAALKITFSDKSRPNDQEFTVVRELRGCAILAGGPTSSGGTPNTVGEDTTESKGTGIAVSHDSDLEFSVERSSPDEPFAQQTKELVITKSTVIPSVFFKAARVCSPDDFVASWFSARLEGDSKWIEHDRQRIVTVCFAPQREGRFEATLELTLCDHTRKADFVIKRMLIGRAKQPTNEQRRWYREDESAHIPGARTADDWADASVAAEEEEEEQEEEEEEEELLDSEDTGIFVSHEDGLDFCVIERKRRNARFGTSSSLLTIQLADGFPAVTFVKERMKTSDGSDPGFVACFEGDSRDLKPGTESTVRVIFSPKFDGVFKATLELVFYDDQRSARFVVRRRLQGIAGSRKDHEHLASFGQEDGDRLTGINLEVPPQRVILLFPNGQHRKSRYLPDYEVPPMVQEAVDKASIPRPYEKSARDLVLALKPDSLNMDTYQEYFKALLNVEDGQQQWNVRCQPPHEVDIQLGLNQRHYVEIENEDEDLLPEVVLGDFLWLDDTHNDTRYEARVTHISVFTRGPNRTAVLKMSLRLPTEFNLYQGTQILLRFRQNRVTLRRQYHALATSFPPPRRLLFPSVSDIKSTRRLSEAEINVLKFNQLVNRNIRDDPQQSLAVISILEQPKGSVPFIIYGPPGTGKTSTIVEIIMQLVRRDASVRVLACAPSNAAADLLVKRLAGAGLDPDQLYRLNAYSRDEEVTEDVRTFSVVPRQAKLLEVRVVLSTCASAGMLQTWNVPVGHFSHIVIDEAAQADEPLVMIPIMMFSNAHTNVILAGDPNQLSPVIKSPTAAKAGLAKSYLRRLMLMREVYGLDTHVGKTIVNLQRNRRSHGAILAWSNRYMYEDMMRDYGNSYVTHDLVLSEVLPEKGFPVVFHGVRGKEERMRSSPSYFNILEASVVRDYCVKLTGDPERKIYPEEIGVLAPYKAQVRAIRQLLKTAKLSDITVGSVEQFQGQERKVIILATTRSNEENHPRRSLGFLANRQRTNVAITRAEALLIVVGDPEVLGKDELWRTFLNYIKLRKGWTGKGHSWNAEDVVHVPGYEIVPRKGDIVHGDEFIDGKSEMIYRVVESDST